MQLPVAIIVLLLFSYSVLRASAQSGQLGNAAEPDAEENRTIGCYALEPEEGTVIKLETANSSAALLRAQCYSVCLEQVCTR